MLLLNTLMVLTLLRGCNPIKCFIGFGQRGLLRDEGISWPRTCPTATYCWEAVTTDIAAIEKLFTFHWDPYYYQFYVRACGGDFGTLGTNQPPSTFNISVPVDITGKGGAEFLQLNYACGSDLCSDAVSMLSLSLTALGVSLATLVVLAL